MESTTTLAQFLGMVFIVFGAFSVIRHEWLVKTVKKIEKQEGTVYLLASIEFLSGLLIVALHNVWVFGWPVLITILGWGAMLEGIVYLFIPVRYIMRETRFVNKKDVYIFGGEFSILFGLFLLGVGFGLF